MNLQGLPISVAASIVIGITQSALLIAIWAYIAVYSPHVLWLIDRGLVGTALYATLFPLDLLVNVLLCLPAAYLICKLRPVKLWLYSTLAVIPAFVWVNRLLISEPERIYLFVPWYSFVPGWIQMLVTIPLAVFIIHRLTRRLSRTRQAAPLN